MKNTVILLSGVAVLALTACAGSFGKARQAMKNAPEWYEARRKELRGEGYPELVEVPVIEPENRPGKSLPESNARVAALAGDLAAFERGLQPAATPAEIEALFARVRADFDDPQRPGSFLTDAEVAALREQFNVPRVTVGVKGRE